MSSRRLEWLGARSAATWPSTLPSIRKRDGALRSAAAGGDNARLAMRSRTSDAHSGIRGAAGTARPSGCG
eukprot:5595960-Karenia_brevis.AAC.1